MTAPAPARQHFLDAFRGVALIAMVLNHTARWWLGGVSWPRYHLAYFTVTIAAPIFLFLVGFCPHCLWCGSPPPPASIRVIRNHRLPFRVFPDVCLPALSLLPGQIPAQLARCRSLGKQLISTPSSAMITSAVRVLIPGIVSSCVSGAANGAFTNSSDGLPDKSGSLVVPTIFLAFALLGVPLIIEYFRVWHRLEPVGCVTGLS